MLPMHSNSKKRQTKVLLYYVKMRSTMLEVQIKQSVTAAIATF